MKKLKRYMSKNNMTRSYLAKRIKVSEATVSYWLAGGRQPTLRNAIQIEKLTRGQISVYDLA